MNAAVTLQAVSAQHPFPGLRPFAYDDHAYFFGREDQTYALYRLIETQTFPTQYPHIVVERTDVFRRPDQDCLYVEWRAVRLQNQRKSTLINRALDMSNLALEIAKFVSLP